MNKSSATIMAAALMLASSCTDIKQVASLPKHYGQWDV